MPRRSLGTGEARRFTSLERLTQIPAPAGQYLVLSRAIEWYTGNGIESLDFGRTDTNNEGLRSFKRRWGQKKERSSPSRYGLRESAKAKPGAETQQSGSAICRHLPVPILRMAGRLLYRHMG